MFEDYSRQQKLLNTDHSVKTESWCSGDVVVLLCFRFHHSSGWTTSDCRRGTRCSHNRTAESRIREHSSHWQRACPSPHCRDCSPPGVQTWTRSWRLGRSGERPSAVVVVAVAGGGRRSVAAGDRQRTSGPEPASTHQELHYYYTPATSAKLNWSHCWYWDQFVEHATLAENTENSKH